MAPHKSDTVVSLSLPPSRKFSLYGALPVTVDITRVRLGRLLGLGLRGGLFELVRLVPFVSLSHLGIQTPMVMCIVSSCRWFYVTGLNLFVPFDLSRTCRRATVSALVMCRLIGARAYKHEFGINVQGNVVAASREGGSERLDSERQMKATGLRHNLLQNLVIKLKRYISLVQA